MKQQYQYMQGSKNSRPGGWIQGVSAIKIFFFWSSTYFIEVNWFISKKILIFHGSRGGPSILPVVRMDSNFFQGGGGGGGVSRCLIIPYLSPYNLCCVFQGGLVSPLDPSMQYLDNLDAVTKVRYLKKLSILNLPEYMVSGKTAIEA